MAKIVYACGNRNGANSQLYRFLKDNNHHEIKVAAYLRSSQFLNHIDWTLDALNHPYIRNNRSELKQILSKDNVPSVGVEELFILMEEINAFEPDLVICDFEPIVSNIASSLGLRLWYCSPVHLYDGVQWQYGQLRYNGLLAKTKQTLLRLPEPEKKLVYSPFGDLSFGPSLKDGFEWVRPYYISDNKNQNTASLAVVNDLERLPVLSKVLNCIPPFNLTLFSPFEYKLSHLECQDILDEDKYSFVLSNAKWLLLTGETSYLADAMYRGIQKITLTPNLNDPEELLNASLCRSTLVGDDLGQVEFLEKYAVDTIQKSLEKAELGITDYLDIKNNIVNLTERIKCDL